jgi:predicted regulator of amino acid metabolism with ACT domain
MRLTLAQRRLLQYLHEACNGEHISYDALAAELFVERRTVITAVKRLEHTRRIVKIKSRGGVANRYFLIS